MGEINVQSQNETLKITTPPLSHNHKQPIMANSPLSSSSSPICNNHIHQNQESVVEPTDLFSMMQLTTPPCCHHNPPCSAASINPMKRRSPPSFSGEPCAKKLFCDQEDLSVHGFSTVTVPINLKPLFNKSSSSVPVLRRCVSDPYQPPAPEKSPPPARSSGLPPLPPKYRRSVSDLSATPEKALTSSCLSLEETAASDSVKLRRMKERLKEMKQWCDEVMKDEEEEKEDEREEKCEVVAEEDDKVLVIVEEDDKVLAVAEEDEKPLPQNDLVEDYEEAVSVHWTEKCLRLLFRCPCGKGYEILLSEKNCYYKLV